MFRALTLLALLALTSITYGFDERKLYIGKNSSEATLTFSFHVEIRSEKQPTKKEVEEALENQVSHLFGPMGEAEIKAVPKGDHVLTNVSEPKLQANSKDLYEVSYDYKGTIAVENAADKTYTSVLPFNPEEIYEQAKVGNKKPCTDSHYDEEGDFWYFWNPDKSGCRLKEGVHFARVPGQIVKFKNTTLTYPEYDRLVRTEKRGLFNMFRSEVIRISILMGMDEETENHNPLKSKDINAQNFRDGRKALLKMGFKAGRPWTHRQIEDYFKKNIRGTVYVEELTKNTPKGVIIARMFFGPSDMDEKDSQAFHYFFKDAMENQSVLIYDGHSGLGGHLDLKDMEEKNGFKIQPDQNNYQIYYFNSCSSYTYYNTQYFGRKKSEKDVKGTKNLDILTNGLATLFSVMHDTNMAVVKAIDLWATGKGSASFQVLVNQIDSDNLFGVNGDEDNPTSPRR